jgi:hypothetical protein
MERAGTDHEQVKISHSHVLRRAAAHRAHGHPITIALPGC